MPETPTISFRSLTSFHYVKFPTGRITRITYSTYLMFQNLDCEYLRITLIESERELEIEGGTR